MCSNSSAAAPRGRPCALRLGSSGLPARPRRELADFAVVDSKAKRCSRVEEDGGAVPEMTDRPNLRCVASGSWLRAVDEIEIPSRTSRASPSGNIPDARMAQPEFFLVVARSGVPAGRTEPVEGAPLVPPSPPGAAEVDPLRRRTSSRRQAPARLRASHDDSSVSARLSSRGDRVRSRRYPCALSGAGRWRGRQRQRERGEPRGGGPRGGGTNLRGELHGEPPPFLEGRYCPGIGRSGLSAAQ